ncbi:MAG TPA: hypothetical protein VFG51_00635, partial [Candidatus Saccharimonadia bacterium]|nr:hypothetical protein [Candidatus Saccharimonadia bacterium]
YWTHTVPESSIHIEKLFLNWGRRIEYFSLFFIMFSAIKKRAHALWMMIIFAASTLIIGLYGVGQKYLLWPVYSTMNREFSKGLQLYLTPHARVQSTFGGHYDFAAFLVMALPITLVLAFYVKKKWMKVVLYISFLVGLWGMMMTSSRSSFLAYVAAITLLMIFLMFRKGFLWAFSRLVVIYLITGLFFMYFGDLLDRFGQIFKDNQAFSALQQSVASAKQITDLTVAAPPSNGISIEDVSKAVIAAAQKQDAGVVTQSDTLPAVAQLPPDVFDNIPDQVIATKSAQGKDIEVVIPRVFSDNAHRLGLSAAIRLDTLWPFAIRGFLRNPLFGSGYSTLTKYTTDEFTEAESTDNDFLRTLGETGALGFVTFYGIMIVASVKLWKDARKTDDELTTYFAMVFTAITIGLFVNAVYIDVFVSSKVAETYWMLAGIMLAYGLITRHTAAQADTETSSLAPVRSQVKAKGSKRKKA